MKDYAEISGRAMLSAALTYDCARAAEKMGDPNCCGKDNVAWKEGPFLSSPANMKDIDRSHPYCLKASPELEVAAEIALGPNPRVTAHGGANLPLPPRNSRGSRVEPVIARLAMIEQFELWKQLLIRIDGPFNKKRSEKWRGRVKQEVLSAVELLTDRRNELTHDSQSRPATMKEAVEYFKELRRVADALHEASPT